LEIHRLKVSAPPSLRKPFAAPTQQNTTKRYSGASIMPLPKICHFRKWL
jgi:hypothetical protein